jgi:hypothetical protein
VQWRERKSRKFGPISLAQLIYTGMKKGDCLGSVLFPDPMSWLHSKRMTMTMCADMFVFVISRIVTILSRYFSCFVSYYHFTCPVYKTLDTKIFWQITENDVVISSFVRVGDNATWGRGLYKRQLYYCPYTIRLYGTTRSEQRKITLNREVQWKEIRYCILTKCVLVHIWGKEIRRWFTKINV